MLRLNILLLNGYAPAMTTSSSSERYTNTDTGGVPREPIPGEVELI